MLPTIPLNAATLVQSHRLHAPLRTERPLPSIPEQVKSAGKIEELSNLPHLDAERAERYAQAIATQVRDDGPNERTCP